MSSVRMIDKWWVWPSWLGRQIVALEVVGSNPTIHPRDPLAQSAEHLTFNQGVPRSSRGWITNTREWRNWQTR